MNALPFRPQIADATSIMRGHPVWIAPLTIFCLSAFPLTCAGSSSVHTTDTAQGTPSCLGAAVITCGREKSAFSVVHLAKHATSVKTHARRSYAQATESVLVCMTTQLASAMIILTCQQIVHRASAVMI